MDVEQEQAVARAGGRRGAVALVAALVLLAGTVGLLLGQRTAPDLALTDPVSVGFARDMQTHHAQAVAMSEPIHRRSDDRDLARLAFDILATQQGQIGIMTAWLDLSRQSPGGAGPDMAWMGGAHRGHDGTMPGMATTEQIAALDTLPLPQATEQYLRLMIAHHRGALPMAQHAAQHAEHPEVRRLAQGMYDGQASEIDLMQDMLAARGLPPEPEAEGGSAPAAPGHSGHG